MSLSTAIRKVAGNVLGKFGTTVTFTQETSTSFDPVLGVDTVSSASFNAQAIKEKYSIDEVDGENVLITDVKLLIEYTATQPLIGDSCLIGAVSYRVMNVSPLDPMGETIVTVVQLRV